MSLLSPAVGALYRKELRQVRRSRGALMSATLLPLLLMLVLPLGQLFGLQAGATQTNLPTSGPLPPGLAELSDPVELYLRAMLPLFIALGGLVVPSVSATYTVVAEREKRSIELLLALPVRVRDVLVAKLLAMLTLACAVVVPLFAIDMAVLLSAGLVTLGYAGALFLVLLSALACSVGVALLLALLSRDFRTANNLNGALIGPLILAIMGLMFGVPGDLRLVAEIALLLGVGVAAVVVALRWLTFERYLA